MSFALCLSQAVLDYMRNYQHTEDHFSYVSSSVYWTGAYVLADLLVSEGETRADMHGSGHAMAGWLAIPTVLHCAFASGCSKPSH